MVNAKPLYINQSFDLFEAFRENAVNWNLDFKKLDTGAFKSRLALIDYGKVQITAVNFDSKVIHSGLTPIGYRTFMLAADKHQQFGWFSRLVDINDLLPFPKDNTIDSYSGEGHYVHTIAIKNEYLEELLQDPRYARAAKILDKDNHVVRLSFNYLLNLRALLQALLNQANLQPDSLQGPAYSKMMLERVPELLLSAISEDDPNTTVKNYHRSDLILFKTISYLKGNVDRRVPMTRLCKDLNVSERTLRHIFEQRLGISPSHMAKSIRLTALRKDILNSKNGYSISEAASKYGFTHLGQLSADYKRHFGETPRETRQAFQSSQY